MAEAFTMFEKFGEALEVLSDDDRKTMFYAIGMYGCFGVEVALDPYLHALFIAFKEDIDHSKASRKTGAKGGRPKRVSENAKPPVFETEKPGVSDSAKPPVSANAKPNTKQYKAIQDNTDSNRRAKKPFSPPTADEVAAYSHSIGKPIDAERFCDYFAAQGWKLSNGNPMKDWKAAARNWWDRDHPKEVRDASPYDSAF